MYLIVDIGNGEYISGFAESRSETRITLTRARKWFDYNDDTMLRSGARHGLPFLHQHTMCTHPHDKEVSVKCERYIECSPLAGKTLDNAFGRGEFSELQDWQELKGDK